LSEIHLLFKFRQEDLSSRPMVSSYWPLQQLRLVTMFSIRHDLHPSPQTLAGSYYSLPSFQNKQILMAIPISTFM